MMCCQGILPGKQVWATLAAGALFFVCILPTYAQSKADELKSEIEKRNSEIQELEKEITIYQQSVERVGKQAATLNGAVKELDATDKKLGSNLKVTQKKIDTTDLAIRKLALEIEDKETHMGRSTAALKESFRRLDEIESQSLVEVVLLYDTFSTFWAGIESLETLQASVYGYLKEMKNIREELGVAKENSETEQKKLTTLKGRLADQKTIVVGNKKVKAALLFETKNKEANYKKLLADKQARRLQLEKELRDFEARLKVAIDPGSLPQTGTGALGWPLADPVITQNFGNTAFATKNSQVYNGNGHNGIDLRAPIGTPILSSADGVVVETGDTDKIHGCYSYGKWVLVRHPNNLSTLYAHLSLIRTAAGQQIAKGDLVGYSGNTGYSTGPHLHLTVYASVGVRIVDLKEVRSNTNCPGARIPVASFNAYLNPLSFLPQTGFAVSE